MNMIDRIKQCRRIQELHQVHAQIITTGLLSLYPSSSSLILTNLLHAFTIILLLTTPPPHPLPHKSKSSLTSSYYCCYALSLFNLISHPSTFCYNTIIRAHTLLSRPLPALLLFVRMRRLSLPPDSYTFPFALTASARLPSLSLSRALHSQALKFGFAAHLFVRNTLIRAFFVCGGPISDACRLFDESPQRDVVSYNALIDGLVKAGHTGRARDIFDKMPLRDAVSWGTLLAGYARTNQCKEAIQLFNQMLAFGVPPDNVALLSALSACAQLGELERGISIHNYIDQNRIRVDAFLSTGLVDLYSKCGCVDTAREIFESSAEKNLFTWNAMLGGLAMHGHGELSLHYFSRMIRAGVQPDGVSFLGVLVGCSHAGLVDKARQLFDKMEDVYRVPRELKHYGCMADLLGRAGLIREAMEMIDGMPMGGDVFVWGGLLGGCRIHGNVEIAEKAAEHVMELNPTDGGVYSIMANIYANAERWDDVAKMRRLRNDRRVKKNAGCSLIQLNGLTHEFVAGDTLHPQTDDIYLVLHGMGKHQFEAC